MISTEDTHGVKYHKWVKKPYYTLNINHSINEKYLLHRKRKSDH